MWADEIQEKLIIEGFTFISIRGIPHFKFLITFRSEDMIDMIDNTFLKTIFVKMRNVQPTDLIVPRITWLICDGLPVVAWNDETIRNLIGEWGYLISKNKQIIVNKSFFNPKICIATMKVIVDGLGHWVSERI